MEELVYLGSRFYVVDYRTQLISRYKRAYIRSITVVDPVTRYALLDTSCRLIMYGTWTVELVRRSTSPNA